MSASRGHHCPVRRKSRSLRCVVHRCMRQDTSAAKLEEILRLGDGQWSWMPTLEYRRDPFSRSTASICPRHNRVSNSENSKLLSQIIRSLAAAR